MVTQERVTQIIEETDWSIEEEPYDPYFYILGLDPGGTTGVAVLRINTDDEELNPELVYLHQVGDGRYGFKRFFGDSQVALNVQIVSEKWKERNVKGANREPQYIEGLMHMLWDDENIYYQYPSQKELIPDEWLKKNNLWVEGKRHEMDALKHALAYLRNQEHPATLKSLSGEGEPMAQPGEAEDAEIQPGDQPGEGEGEGEESEGDAGEAVKSFVEAMEALAKAVQEAGEAAEGFAEGLGTPDKNAEPTGPGSGGGEDAHDWTDFNDGSFKGDRKRRERNGAFSGFNPEDYESGTTLLDD